MQRTVLLGFLVGALLAACGGDDRLTAEDYFERLNRIADDRATATDEIGPISNNSSGTKTRRRRSFSKLSGPYSRGSWRQLRPLSMRPRISRRLRT